MTFLEFLQANNREQLHDYLRHINKIAPLDASIHADLCDLLKIYMVVGGMPEAVKTYIDQQNFTTVRQVHTEIIKAYLLDFSKHAAENQIMKITRIWESLSTQLAKENKKFIFSKMKSGARTREYEIALQWLFDAGLVYPAYNITTPSLPLKAYLGDHAFKLYCLDIGLLGAMSDLNPQVILEKGNLFTQFKGALTENLAAQMLKSQGARQLFYWTSGNTAEVDFIVQEENAILPLEIKAGISNKKKFASLRYQI